MNNDNNKGNPKTMKWDESRDKMASESWKVIAPNWKFNFQSDKVLQRKLGCKI